MSAPTRAADILAPLGGRVDAALGALDLPADGSVVDRLDRLADAALQAPSADVAWLLWVAASGAFPTAGDVRALLRRLRLCTPGDRVRAVLELVDDAAVAGHAWERGLRIVSDRVLVDVDFCARNAHNTGIQRVVRSTVPHWDRHHALELVAWNGGGYRALTAGERDRVLRWGEVSTASPEPEPLDLVVPWRSRVLVPEVPALGACAPLAGIAEVSGNGVHLLAYDTIPIGSADLLPASEAERFAHYLRLVKYATSVAAISHAVADEFAGFLDAVRAQGLVGPAVHGVPLAQEFSGPTGEQVPEPTGPRTVLVVGSLEARKNHRAVVHAMQRLWREGSQDRLVIVGGGSIAFTRRFDAEIDALRSAGRPVEVRRGVGDVELSDLYARADVCVFPSLQEGFGLPVVEALAHGTPVITSDHGSLAEIAEGGGCVLIDPRDDEQLLDALRRVLGDDELRATLRAEALARVPRTWAEYAEDAWVAMGGAR